MKKFEGILICSDLDGTLLCNNKNISQENIKAIEYFKQNGGVFTFVTGRIPVITGDIYNTVKPNAPIGCFNGGGLYSFESNSYIFKKGLPPTFVELVECVEKNYPNVGIMVNGFEKVYFSKQNEVTEWFRKITASPNLECNYKSLPEPVAKIIFGCNGNSTILNLEQTLRQHPKSNEFDFVRTEETFFEMLPKGTSKGAAVEKLAEYLNININKTVAIGDYNNDVSMLKTARVGVAVANASKEAKLAADYITVSNEQHAVAQVIYDLENGKFNI